MRVELVAAPIRYPRTPLLVLFLVALVPVVGLTTLLLWSDTKADEYEAVEAGSAPIGSARTTTSPVRRRPSSSTALMTYRRAPAEVAAVANANQLAEQVDPVYGYLDERSCSSVSVNGRHVTGINEIDAGDPGEQSEVARGRGRARDARRRPPVHDPTRPAPRRSTE